MLAKKPVDKGTNLFYSSLSVYNGNTGPVITEHMGPANTGITGPLSMYNNKRLGLTAQLFFLS